MQAQLYRAETLFRQGDTAGAERAFDAALVLARELGTTEEQWKALYGLGRTARARGRDEEAAARFREALERIESIRARLQLSTLKTDFLADKRDVYDALLEMTVEKQDVAAIFALLERSRARTFQDRLARGPPDLGTVQARLGPGAVLLEFWVGPRGAAAVWVTSESSGITRLPGLPHALERIPELLKEISTGSGDRWRVLAASIADQVLQAIPPLKDHRHLLVVPDGRLGELPFELLPAADGSLLVERYDVSYLPAATVVQRERPRNTWSFPWRRQLVAFADPQVGSLSKHGAPETLAFGAPSRLPASAAEAREIARLARGRAEINLGAADVKAHLLGGGAAGVPLLHLATHAVADVSNPERSRILFSPASEAGTADYLFLKEVYDLDLRGVDLATLSACETERGRNIRGEGVQGFGQAMLAAGSRAAVTALWRVEDDPTREFMKQFYSGLNRGVSKAEALRLAKLRFLQLPTPFRHPRFWAAFVLSGDGIHAIPPVLPWSGLIATCGFLMIACAAAVHCAGRRKRRRIRGKQSGSEQIS